MKLALLVLLVACSSRSAAPPAAPAAAPQASEPTRAASTGPLSETEFKALHELPTTAAPPRHGQTITLADGSRAYLALPAGEGPFPAIVVVHEWWGLNPHIEHWADRLASAGWAAVAVDLYGTVATSRDEAMAAMKKVDAKKAKQTIAAAFHFLTTDARIRAATTAVIGWCFGGAWSLETALDQPELDGAILYYGQLETDPTKLAAIEARMLAVFGTRDEGIPVATVDAFEAALKQAGVTAQILRYDAEHGFANPSNPKYDVASAGDAWSHVLAFLAALPGR